MYEEVPAGCARVMKQAGACARGMQQAATCAWVEQQAGASAWGDSWLDMGGAGVGQLAGHVW